MVSKKVIKMKFKKIVPIIFATSSFLSAFEVQPVTDAEMKKGCVDCHFVYQADFLPKKSWKKMFEENELADHFGKKVVLSETLKQKFLQYYSENASDSKDTKYRRKIQHSLNPNQTYMRISKVPYIKSKHEDLEEEMFIDNPKVKSYANCNACHKADKGEYEEDEVKVPNWHKRFFFGWTKN
jgi:hypothetical protein